MQNILKKYCLENKENGLLLIDMPTGSGKTFNILEFIFNNFNNFNNKVFFITPLKKNLAFDKLKEMFEKANRMDEFQKFFLHIKSNMDSLVENFEIVYNNMPEKIKNNSTTKHIKVLIDVLHSSASSEFKQEARTQLREEHEPEFRRLMEQFVAIDENGIKRKYDERIDFVQNNAPWINILYPASKTHQAKVIFMTVDKFLAKNSTIIKPSYTIISDTLIKNSLIFIDEFDSAKENMLNNIIQNSLHTKIVLLDLFNAIYAGLTICDFTKKLMTPSTYNIFRKQNSHNFYNPLEVIQQIQTYAENIKQKYNLQYLYKLESDVKDNAYFLFQDHRFISVSPDNKTHLLLKTLKQENINHIVPADNIDNNTELKDLLFDLKSFIIFFQTGVGFIANNYLHLKLESKEDANLISYDACVKTVLSEFGLEGKFLYYLSNNIVRNKKSKTVANSLLGDNLDFSLYQEGFRYYSILDSDLFDTQSKIQFCSIDETPEKILLRICNLAKVIGVSASSTLRTVTGNFDIQYLEEKLDRAFLHITKEEREYLKDRFKQQTCYYNKVNIIARPLLVNDLNFETLVESFDKDTSKQIFKLFQDLKENYDKIRYLKLFLCIKEFLEDDQQKSFLFLTNKLLRPNSSFDLIEVNKIFELMCKSLIPKAELIVLYGDIETYERKKTEITSKLSKGHKIFVVSTYQTMGAGQNIQYRIPQNFIKGKDYVEINNSKYKDDEKDFDSIYVDKPTNLFVNMNNFVTEEDFVKFIFQVKSLEKIGDMDSNNVFLYIKKGFEAFNKISKYNLKNPQNSINLKLHMAKIIQQAIGRICRTKNKSKNIHIYYDDEIKQDLIGVKKWYKYITINPEFETFLQEINNSEENQQYENAAKLKTIQSSKRIGQLLNFKKENIYKWEELRDIVLKKPTTKLPTDAYSIYLELPEINNKYYYDDTNKTISFNKTQGMIIDQQHSSLDNILSIPGIKKFFEEKGYATFFEVNKYMMTPVIYQHIYKGALGEVVGEFLLNKICGLTLERIRNVERYEKFDFFVGSTYIDFKNFSGYKDLTRSAEVKKIKEKLEVCKGKNAVIINILKPQDLEPEIYIDNIDNNVMIIPYLYDLETKEFNHKALVCLMEYIKNN